MRRRQHWCLILRISSVAHIGGLGMFNEYGGEYGTYMGHGRRLVHFVVLLQSFLGERWITFSHLDEHESTAPHGCFWPSKPTA